MGATVAGSGVFQASDVWPAVAFVVVLVLSWPARRLRLRRELARRLSSREPWRAGDGWRARYRMDGGFRSDEVELDHGGRAWTVVLSRGPDDHAVAGALDRALETRRWEA